MRSCKINGCKTSCRDKERSLFKINDRQKCIDYILATQRLNMDVAIYVCDLHFKADDIFQVGTYKRLKENAVPQLPQLSEFNELNGSSSEYEYENTATNTPARNVNISVEEYKKLVDSTIELIKANEQITKLSSIIRKKDELIEKLKKEKTEKTEYSHLTPDQNEVIEMLVYGLKNNHNKYPEAVRRFCFRMQFHSSSAYRELRKFFNKNIPQIRTLQKWLTCVSNTPGITQVALDKISEIAASYKSRGEELHVCCISDEISLRQQVLWNDPSTSFEGFCDVTESSSASTLTKKRRRQDNNNKVPIVKDALVLMIVGHDFRITVAYQFLNGMDAIDRAAFTKEVIRRVDLTGAKVISLTGDGLFANLTVAKLLGAKLEENKPYFPRPSKPTEKIFIIFDPPHMMKLLRKYLSEQRLQHGEDELQWELLKKLAAKQASENFSLTDKLTRNHIFWYDHKMNVKKAIQIFSNENADALEQLCEDLYEDYVGCEKLVTFLRICNNILDIMNFGEEKISDDHFKQPICSSNIEKFRQAFESFKQFVAKMTIEIKRKKTIKRESVLKQMGFAGMLINIESTIGIYEDYAKNSASGLFYTFQYGQDHLETYFSLVRSGLGNSNNPNVQQFRSAYRKLLFFSPHISGLRTNCNVDFSHQLLTVSSEVMSVSANYNRIICAQTIEIEMDIDTLNSIEMEPYDMHVYASVASNVEEEIIKKIQKQTKVSCRDCLNVFSENSKMFDSLIAKKIRRGQLKSQPCSDTFNIILASVKISKALQQSDRIDYVSVAKTIFSNILSMESLYESSLFELHEQNEASQITHKERFLLEIVDTFLKMKSKRICARISMEEQEEARTRRMGRRARILAGR